MKFSYPAKETFFVFFEKYYSPSSVGNLLKVAPLLNLQPNFQASP